MVVISLTGGFASQGSYERVIVSLLYKRIAKIDAKPRERGAQTRALFL